MLALYLAGVPRRLQIIQGPDNITVAMGTEVSMHCAVRGFPVPMVHWFKDGCLLTNCSASFSLQNNGQLLTFRSDPTWDKRNINSLLFVSAKFNDEPRTMLHKNDAYFALSLVRNMFNMCMVCNKL